MYIFYTGEYHCWLVTQNGGGGGGGGGCGGMCGHL